MTHETNTPPPGRRTFGPVGIALAVAISAIVAASATLIFSGRIRAASHGHEEPGSNAGTATAEAQAERWQCPMHPSIIQHHPGDCPICGMKLVKVSTAAGGGGGGGPAPDGLTGITIDPARQQLIGMRIVHAESGPVGGAWRTNGRVAVDETRIRHVNVKFNGFMEQVYADFIGKPVRRGEPLYSIYSPELLSAQEEYLLALRTRRTLGGAGGAISADGEALVRASRRKLELWDVPQSEIARIEKAGEASRTVTFFSPATGVLTKKDVVPGMRVNAGEMPFEIVDLSHVWVLADAYEGDLRHVKVGLKAHLTLKAFPSRLFEGHVAFIDPLLDPRARTTKVRIDFANPTGDLRPEMFGEVVIAGKAREALRVPTDAVIDSGTRSVVFVSLPDGKFQPRTVTLGDSDGTFSEIVSGLAPGDGVVTRANFLVDSESRLRASLDALKAPTPSSSAAAPAALAAPAPQPSTDPHAGHGR